MKPSEEYAFISIEIKRLEERKKELAAQLMDYMQQENITKQKTEHGTFSIASRKSWTYTDNVKKLEMEYKTLKNREEKMGIATFKENFYLLFK